MKIDTVRDQSDSLDLRYSVTPSSAEAVSKYVVFLNGRTEWLEKYAYLPKDLGLDDRTGFLTMDHRGQGASGGARAFVDSSESYGRDSAAVINKVVGNKPYIIVAHSMGCLIALYATLKGLINPTGLVLCSPLLGLPNWPVPRILAKPTSQLLSSINLGSMHSGAGNHASHKFELNQLTHDFDKFQAIKNSPYPLASATFGWANATFLAISEVFKPENLKKLNIPVQVIVGTNETVVDPHAFQEWIKLASQHASGEIEFVAVPGGKHELLSEIPQYYDKALTAIKGFLRKH